MRTLPAGIYTAVPTFFHDNEDLDIVTFKKHIEYVAIKGTIPVVAGTMGEAVHLSADERVALVEATREVLDRSPATSNIPVVVGVGSSSTRDTIELADASAQAGADFVMIIPPGYYASALKADSMVAIKKYIVDVSEASPVPLIVYNFPSASSGIDMDSDFVIDVVKSAPNVCGMKFTCANVSKIGRITSTLSDATFQAAYPRRFHVVSEKSSGGAIPYFSAIDGFIDILLPSMAARSSGAITAISNVVPKSCVKLWELCLEAQNSAHGYAEAQRLQDLISNADAGVQKIGVAGMKALLNSMFGYGGNPRRPLLPFSDQGLENLLQNSWMKQLVKYESELGHGAE